jgi:hypothetical protein
MESRFPLVDNRTDLGCVWQSSGSIKPTLELLLYQFSAPSWSWTLNLEMKRCVWQR